MKNLDGSVFMKRLARPLWPKNPLWTMARDTEKKEFLIPTDLAQVQKTSAKVLAFLKPLSLEEACLFDIRLSLEEALINAMKYGNKLQKNLKVLLKVEAGPDCVRLTVEDKGEGFDVRKIKDCTHGENLLKNRGRGVYLIQQLMDQVRYNSKGNCVVMVKRVDFNGHCHS